MSKNVWEDTLIIAFRDLQWLKNIKSEKIGEIIKVDEDKKTKSTPIEMLFKFDGNAESLLGDTLANIDERFFLIEFKGNDSQLKSEWEGKSKRLYMFMYIACSQLKRNSPESKNYTYANVILKTSLTGHYIAYWDMEDKKIICEPYISGLAAAAKKIKEKPKYSIENYGCVLDEKNAKISAEDLLKGGSKCISFFKANEENSIERGLSSVAMKKYIEWLVGGNKSESDVKGIIIDGDGRTRAIFSSAADLIEIAKSIKNSIPKKNSPSMGSASFRSVSETENIPDQVFKGLGEKEIGEISIYSNCLRTLAEVEYMNNSNEIKNKNTSVKS